MILGLTIVGTGSAAPENRVTNDDLAKLVDTSDEWIVTRTGIRARHLSTTETTLSLALSSAQEAISRAAVAPQDIALVVCATVTPDQRAPALSCFLQRDLKLRENLMAFDVNAACSGFLFSLICAERMLNKGEYALVVGSETLSRITDFSDRSTCVLFGDGAGAMVVQSCDVPFLSSTSVQGDSERLFIERYISMDGQAVFKFAVEAIVNGAKAVVEQAGCTLASIDCFICHQANKRILESAAKRLHVSPDRFFMNLAEYGNTSAASIPLAFDEAVKTGAVQRGNRVVLAGFGGGLTSGAVYLEY